MANNTNYTALDSNGSQSQHSSVMAAGTPGTNWSTMTPSGNDIAGQIVAVSSGVAPAAGNAVTVAFATPYAVAPKAVIVSGPLNPYATAVTNTGFTVTTSAAGATTTTYTWHYHVTP